MPYYPPPLPAWLAAIPIDEEAASRGFNERFAARATAASGRLITADMIEAAIAVLESPVHEVDLPPFTAQSLVIEVFNAMIDAQPKGAA